MTSGGIDPAAFNAFEAAGWQERAAGYDAFFAAVTGRIVEPLLAVAVVGPGTRLLDVGTGPGYAAAAAAALGAHVTGVDIAPSMVELARRAHPEVDFQHADAEALPFPDGSFDAVVSNFGILHLGRPERAAGEFSRVLAPGGMLALSVWDVPARARVIGVFIDAMAEAGATAPQHVPTGPPFFRFSVDGTFRNLLTGAGLVGVGVDTLAFVHRVPSPDALWDGVLEGTVRTSASVLRQPADVRDRIRAAFDRLVAVYLNADGELDLPVSVKLASGRKPD